MVKRHRQTYRLVSALLASLLLECAGLCAQEIAVPLETQFSLLPKILSFEKNVSTRFSKTITVGIVYQRKFRLSSTIKDDLLLLPEELTIDPIGKVTLSFVPIEYSSMVNLFIETSKLKPDILYIAPLRSAAIGRIAELCQQLKIISFTGVPEYVDEGIGLGIGLRNGRPLIVMNLSSVKKEGLNFSARLLTIAKLIE